MSQVCDCCGRGPATGNLISHSHRRTRRRWKLNLFSVRVDLGCGEAKRMRICSHCLRSGKVKRAV